MMTLYLRLPDETAALALFSAVTGQPVASLAEVPSKVWVGEMLCDVDPIGAITDPAGQTVDGWHVNIWTPDEAVTPDMLAPFVVHPATPSRVFG